MSNLKEQLENDHNYQMLSDSQKRAVYNHMERFESLQTMNRDSFAWVPESIFVNDLLPVLARKSSGEQVDLTIWSRVAGTVMRPLKVYNDRTKEFMYDVPPPIRSISQNLSGDGGKSLYEVALTAEKQAERIPAMGVAHLRSHLTDRVRHVPVDAEAFIAWDMILRKYNYPPLFETQFYLDFKNEENSQESDSGNDDDQGETQLEDGFVDL